MQRTKQAKEAGAVAALLVAIVIAYVLFSSPTFVVLADGTYDATLISLHFTYPPDITQNTNTLTQFAYQTYDYSSLLVPGTPFIAFPAALVRLLTEPFGQYFSVTILAIVYLMIIALSVYLMVSGLYLHSRIAAVSAGTFMAILFMQGDITGYLLSLYDIGAVIVAFTLFVGSLVHALCMPKAAGTRHAALVILSGMFLLCSQAQMIVLAPFVGIGMLLAVLHGMPKSSRKAVHITICVVLVFFCAQSTLATYENSEDLHSDAANYLAVFQGYLPVSTDVQADLAEFGLDESYAADIGRSYYEDSSVFVHDPYSEPEQKALLEKITLEKRAAYSFAYPERIIARTLDLDAHLHSARNGKMMEASGEALLKHLSPYLLIDLILSKKGFVPQTTYLLVAAALCLLLAFIHKGGGLRKLLLSLCALLLGLACYLPCCIMMTGGVDIDRIKVIFIFFSWFGCFTACTAGICLLQHGCRWFSQADAKLRPIMPVLEPVQDVPFGSTLAHIRITRTQLVVVSAIACVAIATFLLLPQKHVGGVNNGDFGRMMDQLDLFWTDDLVYEFEEQLGTRVIEEYTYTKPFDIRRLTPLDATYTLIFPATLVRAYSALTGENFSTLLLAWILVAVTIASIVLILYDLYPLLGRATILFSAGLIAIMLGENYISWYNALFGESSISTGLIMMIACAVHLCVMKRSSKRSILWLLLLGLSVNILAGAKAQTVLALPMGIALIIGLAWYHRPKRTIGMIAICLAVTLMVGCIGINAIGIYNKNEGVSSRQTTWQSVFFGALMIAEDPVATMEELGIDPALEADIGKHAYYTEHEYVYPFNSTEMDEAFFDHVNTFTMVSYYLRHPKDLLHMLDYAAGETVNLHTGFMAYTGETYDETEGLYRFNLWRNLRPNTACHAFWQYVLAYGALLFYLIRTLTRRKASAQHKLFALLVVCVMMIGVIQFPLTVVGNGFADNNKQLYAFMLCHDLLVITASTLGIRKLYRYVRRKEATTLDVTHERSEAA